MKIDLPPPFLEVLIRALNWGFLCRSAKINKVRRLIVVLFGNIVG